MNDINTVEYIGEWLKMGNFGHLLTLVSMVAAFAATIAYFRAVTWEKHDPAESRAWQRFARYSFAIHTLAVIGIFVVLFYLIFNHRFEYKYVWQHSSRALPVHYIISCFWEGQEGSFLLWTFWHAVLGGVVIATGKKWENRTMTILSAMQIFLAAMLIGLYFFDYKLGSSPFVLMRDENVGAPIFSRPNYLEFLQDGRGLNPLLQNYWMVIHPPTLFLGFAATLLPFAYTLAALWQRNFDSWILPTLKWALFAGGILGIGILMGGAWAYESLSFGGFWAWDPVENASLVPWLALVGGIHTLLVYKYTGRALRATAALFIISFMLILYSTFLTRSGILGDTSVHSFTDLGMSGQLLVFMGTFLSMSLAALVWGWRAMPTPAEEEPLDTREFWMFIGSLVLLLVAALITLDTSWPVINKVFGTKKAIVEPIQHYNRYTIWFGMLIGILSGAVQFLRYKNSTLAVFSRKIALPLLLSIATAGAIAYIMGISHIAYLLLLWATLFAIFANSYYLFAVLSGKIRLAGGSIAHIGMGLILLGSLIAFSKQEVISLNSMGIDYGEGFKEEDKRENVLLYKDQPIQMGDYWVTYVGDSLSAPNTYYKVNYQKKTAQNDTPSEEFVLYPNAQVNQQMGLMANPDTRHYWSRDIFTHVSSVADKSKEDQAEQLKTLTLAVGDTALTNNTILILKAVVPNPQSPQYVPQAGDVAASAQLELIGKNGKHYFAEPIYYIRTAQQVNTEENIAAEVEELGITLRFLKIDPKAGKVTLEALEREKPMDFIIMKAVIFPYINLVWIGSLLMFVGFIVSLSSRYRESKRRSAKQSYVAE